MEEATYPVAFLFHPLVFERSDIHYPFDTGAMATRQCKTKVPGFRTYKESFKVRISKLSAAKQPSDGPRILVKHLFSTNRGYLAGQPDVRAASKPSPIPNLLQFITERTDGSDHRRACIETQRHSSLPLNEKLLWLGYPDTYYDQVQAYFRSIEPHLPDSWGYPSLLRYRPSDICAMLYGRASAILDNYLENRDRS